MNSLYVVVALCVFASCYCENDLVLVDNTYMKPFDLGSEIKLRYFDIRGRGEKIRLILHAAGVKFTDERISEGWEEMKKDTDMFAFSQMPQIEIDGKHYVQSGAIVRHIARSARLYGETHEDALMIDMVYEGAQDFSSKLGRVKYGGKWEEEKDDYFNNVAPKWLGFLENLLRKNPPFNHFVGEKLSLADIGVWDVLDSHIQLSQNPELLSPFKGLKRFYNVFQKNVALKTYIDSRD
mmetsp:Transcript_223/g.242  ORF Transcript_223/g.242 Transcript_223/m.242 type:complete len:237 (+) Transcript_223:29-739(+)